jgi:hypothetical protein
MRLEKPVRSGTFSGGSFHFSCSRGMIDPRGGGATAQRVEPPAPRGSNAPCHSSRRDRESAVKRGSARGRRRSGKNIFVIPMSLRAPCCPQRALRWQTLPSKPSSECAVHSRSRLSHSSAPSHRDELMIRVMNRQTRRERFNNVDALETQTFNRHVSPPPFGRHCR